MELHHCQSNLPADQMSGLEPLVALNLACNIFQTVSFGREIIGIAKQVYQNGSLDDAVYSYASDLRGVTDGIRGVRPKGPSTDALSPQEKRLLKVSDACYGSARDLQEEVSFIAQHARQGSLLAAIKVAAKTNWRKRRLDRMESELCRAESVLQTSLLDQIWLVPVA